MHERCCDCTESYHGYAAWPAGKPFTCADFLRLPDAGINGATGQAFPPSRMQGPRKLPRGLPPVPATQPRQTPAIETPAKPLMGKRPDGRRTGRNGAHQPRDRYGHRGLAVAKSTSMIERADPVGGSARVPSPPLGEPPPGTPSPPVPSLPFTGQPPKTPPLQQAVCEPASPGSVRTVRRALPGEIGALRLNRGL